MKRDRAMLRVLWLVVLGALLGGKMVLLEPVTFRLAGVGFVATAALLPLALLLGRPGIGLIALACGLSHWVHGGVWTEVFLVGGAVGVAVGAALLVLQRVRAAILGWLAAGWVLTLLFATTMSIGYGVALGEPTQTFLQVFLGTWIPINGVGVPLALLLDRRLGGPPVRARRGHPGEFVS